jgi:NodT family efflux transporter outer membrane factor (OMF) lipoprotein
MTIIRVAASVPVLAVLAACAVGPAYRPPDLALPASFVHAQDIADTSSVDTNWWQQFHDPALTALIAQALAQNLELSQAAARLAASRAAAAGAGAALLPNGNVQGAASESENALRSPIGRLAQAVGAPRVYSAYAVGTQASWEIDLFGSLRRGREAARAQVQAAEMSQAAVRVAVAAETADAYLTLRGLQAQLRLAADQEQTQSRLVDLVQRRLREGVSADRELQRAIGELERLRALQAPLRAAIEAQSYRIDVLTGNVAGTHYSELNQIADQPIAPLPAASAAPSDLLRRRPDIVAAERQLAAANALIGVAIAEYYPKVSLSALFGLATTDGAQLLSTGAGQREMLAGLRWRLFDFGRVDAEVAGARARDAEVLSAYRSIVLRATEDVEDALARFAQRRVETQIIERELAALTRARDQAQTAYEGGVLPFLEVLDADRDRLVAAERLAVARADEARASVAAFRALGGCTGGQQ